VGRKRRGVQHEFAKRAYQRLRTIRDGDSSVIKDDQVPIAAPDGEFVASAPITHRGARPSKVRAGPFKGATLPLRTRKTDEPVVCFRSWRLVGDERGPALMSVTAKTVWDGPILRAEGPPGDVPPYYVQDVKGHYHLQNEGAIHGIYAYPDPSRLIDDNYVVLGEIEAFGKVVIHEKGIRAECARIRRLLVLRPNVRDRHRWGWVTFTFFGEEQPPKEIPPSDEVIKKLAERYQCDVRWWGTPFTD
jgi:hypothetical protein